MLEGKTRIPPVDVETLPDDLREALEEQTKLRGEPENIKAWTNAAVAIADTLADLDIRLADLDRT